MSQTRISNIGGGSGGSGSASASTLTVTQAGHGFAVGDVIRSSGGANSYTKAQADSAANAEVVGIVTAVATVNRFTMTTEGIVTAGVPANASGTVMFLSDTTAGALTSSEPATPGQVSKPLAVILESGAKMLFSNFRGELLTSVTNTGLTIEEVDGSPLVSGVTTIIVSNGTLTDNGGGQVTITTGGGGGGGSGDVVGPSSATDNAVVRFDSTTGKLIQNSAVILDDSNNITGITNLTATTLITSGFRGGYTSKTTNYTATTSDYFIACDASSGGFTVTLPTASGITGHEFFIKKIDSSGNIVTVDGNASETIDGSAIRTINTQYETLGLISNGSNWYVI